MYKAKLLENTKTEGANGILRNTKIAVTLKYLSKCRVELELKWKNYCFLSAVVANNNDANPNNIIVTIKETKLYVLAVTLSAKDSQKLPKLLSKRFRRSV